MRRIQIIEKKRSKLWKKHVMQRFYASLEDYLVEKKGGITWGE
jgi:hypothetical protein